MRPVHAGETVCPARPKYHEGSVTRTRNPTHVPGDWTTQEQHPGQPLQGGVGAGCRAPGQSGRTGGAGGTSGWAVRKWGVEGLLSALSCSQASGLHLCVLCSANISGRNRGDPPPNIAAETKGQPGSASGSGAADLCEDAPNLPPHNQPSAPKV